MLLLAATLASGLDCRTSVRDIPFERQPVPTAIRNLVPKKAFVRLVMQLSNTDSLAVFELGHRSEPDTNLLVARSSQRIARYRIKNVLGEQLKSELRDWGQEAVAMKVAHLCSGGTDLTYVVLQAGNQGGYFLALHRSGEAYKLIRIAPVQQGRLELSVNNPGRIVVWSVANEDAGDCTACPKHYLVSVMEFDGASFKTLSRWKTTKKYDSFQDNPLRLKP